MTPYAITTAGVLLLIPFFVLRGRTLARCFGGLAVLAVVAALLARQLSHLDEPSLVTAAAAVAGLVTFALFLALAPSTDVRWSANRAGLIALLLYGLLGPAMLRVPIDGDEPFYLLVTESLVRDHDVDLRNQYRHLEQSATRRPDLRPQYGDPTGPHGEQYSRTEPFLSFLLIPGYLAAGLAGAVGTIVLFGALLVRSTVRFMEDEGIDDATIRAVFPLFAFAPPVIFYAARIWPEVPAALALVEGLRGIRHRRAQRWVPALFLLSLLKLRFLLITVPLLLGAAVRKRRYVVIAVIAIAVPLLIAWAVSGSAANVHSWRELLPYGPREYLVGFFGLLLDGASGLLFQAPFYLLGFFAIARWKEMPEGFRLGCWSAALYVIYLVPRSEWHGGWSPPLRYIVVIMPVLALGAAALWSRVNAAIVALIAIWTAGVTIHGIAFPWRLFHIANGENALGEALSGMYHADFSRLFPSFIRLNEAAVVASVILVVALTVFRFVRVSVPPLLVLSVAAALMAWGFVVGQQPAGVVEFEDAHVIHSGGELHPPLYTPMRFAYRGGWLLHAGDSLSTLASGGAATLSYSANEGAVISVAGRVYALPAGLGYRTVLVAIPRSGRVDIRCLRGWVNLDHLVSN